MRELLFRGASVIEIDDIKDILEWYYGSLVVATDRHTGEKEYFIEDESGHQFPVEEETVGQFIGLPDVKGNRIFEGDIVKDHGYNYVSVGAIQYGAFGHMLMRQLLEERGDGSDLMSVKILGFYIKTNLGEEKALTNASSVIEIIGNIHENPELMKK